MLTLLKIRNLALVDELTWELDRGLISVTGETGAGKSVIVGALKLVLGERAEKSLIHQILLENGLDYEQGDDLIIRRVIGQNASRQFINDSPVTLGLLKK